MIQAISVNDTVKDIELIGSTVILT